MKFINLKALAVSALQYGNHKRKTYSSEKKNIFRLILIGIKAKKTSNHLMILSVQLKRLISRWCFSTSLVGKTFVQNCGDVRERLGISTFC